MAKPKEEIYKGLVLNSFFDHEGNIIRKGTPGNPTLIEAPASMMKHYYGCNKVSILTDEAFAALKKAAKPKPGKPQAS